MTRCDPRVDLSGLTLTSALSARILGDADVLDRGEDFVFLHDQVLHVIQLDLLTGVLAKEDGVAGFDVEGYPLAIVVGFAIARGDDLAPLRFFLGGIRNDDAADLLFAFFEALNEDPVV